MNDYEKINESVRQHSAARRNAAYRQTTMLVIKASAMTSGFWGLKTIGFISGDFCLILVEASLLWAAFKVGGIWNR